MIFFKIKKFFKLIHFNLKNRKLKQFTWFGHSYLDIDSEFSPSCSITVGRCGFRKNCVFRVRENASLKIGTGVAFNNNCILTCRDRIEIGNDVIFGPNCLIFDNDHDYKSSDFKNQFTTDSIVIEDNVWIGGNCVILKGSHIGHDSVIGAGCIVKGITPPLYGCLQQTRSCLQEV